MIFPKYFLKANFDKKLSDDKNSMRKSFEWEEKNNNQWLG